MLAKNGTELRPRNRALGSEVATLIAGQGATDASGGMHLTSELDT